MENLTNNEKKTLELIPAIISLNKEKFKYSTEYIGYYKFNESVPTMTRVELKRITQQIKVDSSILMDQGIVNRQLSKTFMIKLLNDIIDSVVKNVESSGESYHVATLKYVIEDAIKEIKQNIQYITNDPGRPFIICGHQTIMKIKIFQDINMPDGIIMFDKYNSFNYDYPIKQVGVFGGWIPVYEIHDSLYSDANGQGKIFGDRIIVGYTGSDTGIGPRLCFKSLYDVTETDLASIGVCGAQSIISAISEYIIEPVGENIKSLYKSFEIYE